MAWAFQPGSRAQAVWSFHSESLDAGRPVRVRRRHCLMLAGAQERRGHGAAGLKERILAPFVTRCKACRSAAVELKSYLLVLHAS